MAQLVAATPAHHLSLARLLPLYLSHAHSLFLYLSLSITHSLSISLTYTPSRGVRGAAGRDKPGASPLSLSLSLSHTLSYLTHSLFEVVLQKSIPTQTRQLILYLSNSKGSVDGYVVKLTFAKPLDKHFRSDKSLSLQAYVAQLGAATPAQAYA